MSTKFVDMYGVHFSTHEEWLKSGKKRLDVGISRAYDNSEYPYAISLDSGLNWNYYIANGGYGNAAKVTKLGSDSFKSEGFHKTIFKRLIQITKQRKIAPIKAIW